ncbi:UNKNOWN [Stylonychia lemnae]|uniref:Uncharacterized protein n=1 Tax=Stylonychia lemnae TaxID=5949 RepID=A0A078A119_STYLE|nr:UNKNOWN [Stylonychia lemnae]|eukprot:CDW75178.1 UNKNOWN [Stylonychia lemnae]
MPSYQEQSLQQSKKIRKDDFMKRQKEDVKSQEAFFTREDEISEINEQGENEKNGLNSSVKKNFIEEYGFEIDNQFDFKKDKIKPNDGYVQMIPNEQNGRLMNCWFVEWHHQKRQI